MGRFPGVLAVLLVLALGGCDTSQRQYDDALARMATLESQVDVAFDAAKGENGALLGDDAWLDHTTLVAALERAERAMTRAVADQRQRIAQEEAILAFDFLADSTDTRVLYLLDLDAQRAKLAILNISLEMYQKLRQEVDHGSGDGYRELVRIHISGIQTANEHYRQLDLARQRRQEAFQGMNRPPI